MAGVVPKRSSSGRKRWPLHDGSRNCLKGLRNQWASDGCSASQVVLAKQLLSEECETDSDSKENAQLGVYWLIEASKQGNLEATDLLKTCLRTGKGITELNYLDVKACLSMTQSEKLARKAAREMFASLSHGGEYITSDQLQKKILSIEKSSQSSSSSSSPTSSIERNCLDKNNLAAGDAAEINNELVYENSDSEEDTDWSQKSDSGNEKLTEDHLVAAAVDYSHGHLPIVNRTLCLSDPNLKALDHIPLIQRPILHPVLALKILYYKLLKTLGRQFILFFPLAKSELQLLCLMLVYTLASSDNILYFFPIILYYATFLIMVITTFQMLQIRREFYDFRLWSGLFICYSSGELNAEQTEYQYIRNNMKSYGIFFVALLINLVIYPVIVDQWIPQSELMIISFCLIFMTLIGFMPIKRSKTQFDLTVLLSFGINVLAKYPYETDPVVAQGWRFLDLKVPTFASYVVGNGIEFCINFRFFLYLCIPVLLVKIASKRKWRGIYELLIPHCVTLSWLQICIISSNGATIFGLLRGSLALVGVVLFLPLVGLTSVILPAAALTKWIITSNFVINILAFILIFLCGLGLCWLCAQSRFKKFTAVFQVFSTFIAVYLLLKSTPNLYNISYDDEKLPDFLSWDVYQKFCNQPIWQDENIAIAQMKCSQLEGTYIHWDGYITDIKIKSINNFWKNILNKFPGPIKKYLYCLYGKPSKDDCDHFPDIIRDECNLFYNSMRSINQCSLDEYNRYTFEITTKMLSGIWGKSPEVKIVVDDFFKNFTLSLKPNDHIWFKGVLFNNDMIGGDGILGGSKTHVQLNEIGCLACVNPNLSEVKQTDQNYNKWKKVLDAFFVGLKFLFNIFLNPIFNFK